MNFDSLIRMIVNVVLRRIVSAGINRGIGLSSRRGKPPGPAGSTEARHHDAARAIAKRARQAARITRRLGR
ncbi:MAG: hypothetical protein ACK4NE_07985 [Albidovulum sp.]